MTGHCSNSALVRMLRSSASDSDVVKAAKHFQCQTCQETEKEKGPAVVRPTRPSFQQKFNFEVSLDVFEACPGGRHAVLSMVDTSTKFHVGNSQKQDMCRSHQWLMVCMGRSTQTHCGGSRGSQQRTRDSPSSEQRRQHQASWGSCPISTGHRRTYGERHGGTFS